MTIQYQICEIVKTTVHIPSEDYYARNGDSMKSDITEIVPYQSYDTLEEAELDIESITIKGEYTILKTYKF